MHCCLLSVLKWLNWQSSVGYSKLCNKGELISSTISKSFPLFSSVILDVFWINKAISLTIPTQQNRQIQRNFYNKWHVVWKYTQVRFLKEKITKPTCRQCESCIYIYITLTSSMTKYSDNQQRSVPLHSRNMTSVNVKLRDILKKWPPNFVMRNVRHRQLKENFKNCFDCGNGDQYYGFLLNRTHKWVKILIKIKKHGWKNA